MADFVKVAQLADLKAGTGKTVEAGGKAIAIFNVDGAIYAMDNNCLHRGGPLGDGFLTGNVVSCPWHLWEYNVCTGELCSNKEQKVNTYAVKVEGNNIQVAV